MFAVQQERPELLIAQATAFSRQVPMLYVVVLVNAVALSFTHFHSAPKLLTIVGPVALALASSWRVIGWWRLRDQTMDLARASKMLGGTLFSASVMAIAFTAWSLSLYGYGDAYQQRGFPLPSLF